MQHEREEEVGRIDVGLAETEGPGAQLRGPHTSQRRPGFEPNTRLRDSGSTSEHGPLGDHYSELREQRRGEERHYRGHLHNHDTRRQQRWDEDEQPSHRVRFEDNAHSTQGRGPNSLRWDDDERELMQWARSKGRGNDHPRHRLPTPPYESPRKQEGRRGKESLRSISAPVIAEGIAGLGARNDPAAQRKRQREYAEELRAQIREREEARQREKMERQGESPKRGITHAMEAQERRPPGLSDKPPGHSSSRNGRGSPPDDRDRGDMVDYSRKPPRPSYDGHKHHTSYPAPSQERGYPAPRYADYLGYNPQMDYQRPWIPPYYQPRSLYPPPPDFLTEPYHPPSQPPRMGNPYFYHGRPGPEFWDPDFRGRRRPDELERRQRELDESPKHEVALESSSDTSPLTGSASRNSKATKQSKASYRAELEQQIQEKKKKDIKGRIEWESTELKKEAEIYDPWGKGGCGAPVRDTHGNLVTDLKKMRRINNDKLLRGPSRSAPTRPPSRTPGVEDGRSDSDDGGSPSRPQYAYSSHEAREKEESEEMHKKSQQEEYRDYLRRQVEEKEANKAREKEQKMAEEQRELDRLEKERKVMQENYQRETEKQQRKEEELRSNNEAMKREAEEKRRAAALKKQQEELREAEIEAERRKIALVEKMEQPLSQTLQQRPNSPPIPALMNKRGDPPKLNPPAMEAVTHPTRFQSSSPPVPALQQRLLHPNEEHHPIGTPEDEEMPLPFRTNSPPVPTLRNRLLAGTTADSNPPPVQKLSTPRPIRPPVEPPRRAPSSEQDPATRQELADRLRQLKRQLQSVTHHGPGSSLSSDHATTNPDNIFETARLQRPRIAVPRAKPPRQNGGGLSAAVKEFGELKKTTSSKEILAEFPSAPETSSMLELQQGALLRHQEERIARLRAGKRESSLRAGSRGSNLLASESLHIPVSGEDPEVDSLHSVRNPMRQPWRVDPLPPREGSAGAVSRFSVATMDIGRLAKRNEERLRRLDAIVKGAEPARDRQTVLHTFLKQTNRTDLIRPSEESLDCETRFHPISSTNSLS